MGLEEVRRDWTRLGAADPRWAVCVERGKRGDGWQDDDFLASGAAEIDATMLRLGQLGVSVGSRRVLDFGCGAGRLSNGLAGHFEQVVGVDISAPMLEEARRLDRSGGRIEFVLNERSDLGQFDDGSFDMVYTDLVLQHLPPALADGYIREFDRIVAPGGVLVLGVPEAERRTFKGQVFRWVPWPIVRTAQRLILRYPAPMRMHTVPRARIQELLPGATIVASDERREGDHWHHLLHVVVTGGGDQHTDER